MGETKRCSNCKVVRSLEDFYTRTGRTASGSWCKICTCTMSRERGKARRLRKKELFEAGELQPISEKWCRLCDDVKPWGEFYMKWDAQDLLSHYCRACHVSDDTMRKRRERKKKRLHSITLRLKPVFCYEINSLRMDQHLERDCV